MGKQKSIEEVVQLIHEKSQKIGLYKLESDEKGNYLLDPSNVHHQEWLENHKDYEVVEQKR